MNGVWKAVRTIVQNEGYRGLTRGYLATVARTSPQVSAFYGNPLNEVLATINGSVL